MIKIDELLYLKSDAAHIGVRFICPCRRFVAPIFTPVLLWINDYFAVKLYLVR